MENDVKNTLPVVTDTELAMVENNMLNAEQLAVLLQKTPKSQKYTRPAKGGGVWTYVTGTYVKKLLNLMFGWDWDFEVVKHEFDLNIKQAYVLGKLTVRVKDRTVTKMQFGRVDIKFKTVWNDELKKKEPTNQPLDIGNDLKAATTDALKKCASELGIASDVYAPNEFKAIKVVDAKDTEALPTEVIEKINAFTDSFDLMDFANAVENKRYAKNQQFIDLINVQRKKLEA